MQKIHRGFTIIELLVVVSIIALLVGILLPAIGKARDQAKLTQSQGNVKNLGTAAVTYAAEYADRQLTYCNDNLSTYGAGEASMDGYFQAHGSIVGVSNHPSVIFGYGTTGAQAGTWGYYFSGAGASGTNTVLCAVPADFSQGNRFGAFRNPQGRAFSTYLNKKFYDPIYFAPKDTAVMSALEKWFDETQEFAPLATPGAAPHWSSYCFSPAAMVNPDVLGFNSTSNQYYNSPWGLAAGWRSPAMSQAAYPDLKTHILEHHWLQNRRRVCSPAFGPPLPYEGCQPYFFNGSRESAPVTLYYDGHIGNRGQRDSIDSDARVSTQTQGQPGGAHGLWTRSTVWGGAAGAGFPSDGYYQSAAIDTTNTSYHILTIDGIKGRDFLSK